MSREHIEGRRLTLRPMTEEQARALAAGGEIGVPMGRGWPHADTNDAVLGGLSTGDPDMLPWLIVLTSLSSAGATDGAGVDNADADRDTDGREEGEVIGDLGWKGTPSPDGVVEIGYGLAAPFRRRGFGAEAVGAFVEWLSTREDVRQVFAEIRFDNIASRRLVERLGFGIDRIEGDYVWYVYETGDEVTHE